MVGESKTVVTKVPGPKGDPASKDHHVTGGFANPWPSAARHGGLLNSPFARMLLPSEDKNNVPLPANREGLVKIRKPDWGKNDDPAGERLKATWIGHATWLVETASGEEKRGLRVLFDPFFSERCSPVTFFGPKRYTPTPCTIQELPWIDALAISHSHYDHTDLPAITELYKKQGTLQVFCGLNNAAVFKSVGIKDDEIHELDWWDAASLSVPSVGTAKLFCTPAQHFSGRTPFDRDRALWCSWAIEETFLTDGEAKARKLYFAGDTGYRHVQTSHPTREEEEAEPYCPAFKEIGDLIGPFDLALLPIGLCLPRDFMSAVHCSPEDSINVHKDVKSKKSIGMHYGTVRGGVSAKYEDVLYPPRRWKEMCEREGLTWGEDVGLCDIGETVVV